MIKSISYDQDEIINNIIQLHCPSGIEVDLTYGNGSFYKNINKPKYCFDIEPLSDIVAKADSTAIPLEASTINSIMFDPPFLTYIKKGREHDSIMAKRFSGYYKYEELEEHYKLTLKECSRVLIKKGILIFKCQNLINNHKMHPTVYNAISWASEFGFRLKDEFLLLASHRMPIGKNKKQQHARIFHSSFLVLEKK